MLDYYNLADFRIGDRIKAFHPQTFGVMHWATITSIGRTWIQVEWHVTGRAGRVRPGDVSEIDRPNWLHQ